MNSETKNTSTGSVQVCQNCKHDFVIESEDFSFYEKIKVPPPTWCPECRLVRKMAWRNERTLYKRKCDAPGHEEVIISMYAPDVPLVVFDQKYWWQDSWDPLTYGIDYDFSRPLFKQFAHLFCRVPLPSLVSINNVNTDYANFTRNLKDCYLMFVSGGVEGNENCAYGYRNDDNRDCFDVMFGEKSEFCYELIDAENCTRVAYGRNIEGCLNSWLLDDCRNCSYCFGCVGLRNKKYHIFNELYSKEEYNKKIKELLLGSYESVLAIKKRFADLKLGRIRKYADIVKSQNVSGDVLHNSKNVSDCFICSDVEESTRLIVSKKTKDSQDGYIILRSELAYDLIGTLDSSNVKFDHTSVGNQDTQYSYWCQNSSHLFACIGLRNKQYCILNKQYSKEEYEELVPKIIKHMNDMPYVDAKGRKYTYGEFFPPELSPFAYNETIAQEYFPLTKEEAIEKGYKWRDPDTKDYKITTKPEDLPDHIKDVPDSITKEIIECSHVRVNPRTNLRESACQEQCTTAFKIIPQELQFYRQMNLPLPRLCPNCRHYERLKQRNPLKLWHRQCECEGQMSKKKGDYQYQNTTTHTHGAPPAGGPCPTEFETSYAPDRPEIIYCGSCYNAEVV